MTPLDVDDAVSVFYNKLREIIVAHNPITRCNNRNYRHWFNFNLIRCIKDKYHNIFKNFGNLIYFDIFILLWSKYKKLLTECYNLYLSSVEDLMQTDIKPFWYFIHSRKTMGTIPQTIHYCFPQYIPCCGNQTVSTTAGVWNLLYNYFGSLFDRSSNLPLHFNQAPAASCDVFFVCYYCEWRTNSKLY